ncbi:MAG: DUF1176 domain-containing protein [Candidatus Sulfotelmatobacter sp.]
MGGKPILDGCRTRWALCLGLVVALLSLPACALPPSEGPVEAKQSNPAPASTSLKKTDLTYADRAAWRAQLKWPQDCEQSFDYPDKSFAGLAFFQLSADRYLVQVTCTLGSYQGTSIFLLLDESRSPLESKLLRFVDYEDSGEPGPNRLQKHTVTELTGTPEFDVEQKQLRLVNKFRGLGDCGFMSTYSFAKEQPELVLFQAKLDCDGKGPFNPREWKKMSPR